SIAATGPPLLERLHGGGMPLRAQRRRERVPGRGSCYGRDSSQLPGPGVGCMGLCSAGPLVSVEPTGTLYQGVRPDDATDIVRSLSEDPVARLECSRHIPFFERQVAVVLEKSGRIDPERVEDYIAAGGYEALIKAIT